MIRERKGEYRKEIEQWAAEGYVRARIDGTIRRLDEDIQLARYEKHTLELVIDRLELKNEEKSRFTEGIEKALRLAEAWWFLNTGGRSSFQPADGLPCLPDCFTGDGTEAFFFQRSAGCLSDLQWFGAVEHFHRRKALRSEIVHGRWSIEVFHRTGKYPLHPNR